MPSLIRFVTLVAALVVLDVPGLTSGLTHGWDCVSCGSNSMLASNFGTWRGDINLTDPWWITTIAKSHAAIILNNFWHQGITPGSYNGTGEDSKVAIARALKAENPSLKVLFYQPADRLGDTAYVLNALYSHPEWWLRDDNGNLIPFGGKPKPGQPLRPQIDTSVPAAQDFFANLSVSLFHSHADAKDLLDGVMVDGTSWTGASRYGPNVSAARYTKLFDGKMAMLAKMQNILKELNGGEVWGNPLLEYGQIGGASSGSEPEGAHWNTTLAFYDGAFDEMFGSFGTMDSGDGPNGAKAGDWDVVKMRYSFDSIINASAAGKTVVIHAFPGPAGINDQAQGGMFPTRGDVATRNTFHVAAWAGDTPVPEDANACRVASADRYGWFYNLEDGYIPCPAHIECGMPNAWFPEYSKPLGPPLGPATTDASRTVWERKFAHAEVFVDLRDRTLSKITWQ